MMTLDEKNKLALRIINGQINIYDDRFKKIYPFTTENISGYIDKFKLKGTKLLTVGSSADQAINASLHGCRDITILDICPYTKEHFYLKNACIQKMSKEEFERFLFYKGYHIGLFENGKVLNHKTFSEISDILQELDADSYEFWSQLFKKKRPSSIRKCLFSNDEYNPEVIRRINPYLQDTQAYEKARQALQDTKMTFLEGDIMTYDLPETYDNIILSNIPCNYPLSQTNKLLEKLISHLNPGGQILVSYLYALYPNLDFYEGEAEIYDIIKAQRELPKPTELSTFKSVNCSYVTDGVLVYKKEM